MSVYLNIRGRLVKLMPCNYFFLFNMKEKLASFLFFFLILSQIGSKQIQTSVECDRRIKRVGNARQMKKEINKKNRPVPFAGTDK